MRNALAVLSTIALSLALAGGAQAQDRRAIVLEFSGPNADALRSEVVRSIESGGWDVAGDSEVQRAASSLDSDPASPEVAAELGARAIVEGRVSRRGRRFSLRVTVSDASTGEQLGQETFAGRGAGRLRSTVRGQLMDRIGGALARGTAPAASSRSTPTRSARDIEDERPPAMSRGRSTRQADDEEEASGGDSGSSGPRVSPLFVAVGATGFARDFSYNDDIFRALRPYQLPMGWTLRAQARWYPGAHFTQDFLANIGVQLNVGGALGLQSRQRDGTTFPTESIDVHGGADLRIPLAPLELGVSFGFGMQTFSLGQSQSGTQAALPNAEYQFLRPAVRARIDVGVGIYTEASFGYRALTSSGGLGRWFPRNSGGGIDLGAYLGWESDLGVGVRAGFEMQRYFFTMNPEPGDPYIAGGAVDQYLAGSVDVTWQLR